MPATIKMPALSPTMTEGKLARWLMKEGDKVRSGDVLAKIETDKATMEVEAVDEGTIATILVKDGTDAVAVNAPIAVLREEGDDDKAVEEAVKAAKSEKAAPKEAPEEEAKAEKPEAAEKASGGEESKSEGKAAATPEAKSAPAPKPSPAPTRTPGMSGPLPPAPRADGERIFASPLARRIAEEECIDLARVTGTGPHGRIVKADVEEAAASGAAMAAGGIFAGLGQDFTPAVARTEVPTNVRKVIARRMAQSKSTVPHFYASIDCDIGLMLALRKEINEADESLKVSVNDFVVRAAALALKKVPAANSSWAEDGMKFYNQADISVAVSTEGGLITPIVRAADRKGVAAISSEVKDLAGRARSGKLAPEEYQGGTFTISNMGMYGVREFAAIINEPQACILAVGAGGERAVVRDGQLAVANMMTVTLSCDHRVVDGSVGAEYIAAFKELIEHPVRLIL